MKFSSSSGGSSSSSSKLQRDTIFYNPSVLHCPKPNGHLRAVHLVVTSEY